MQCRIVDLADIHRMRSDQFEDTAPGVDALGEDGWGMTS